jgi:hypothetical protein
MSGVNTTVAPEDIAAGMPYRFFPSMSAVDTDRMPSAQATQ